MGSKTGIEWTDATWNPIRGCTAVSEGCRNCYAAGVAARFSGPGQPYEGLAKFTPNGPQWTGKLMLVEKHLRDPLKWKEPKKIFVNSMSDLFHKDVPLKWIDLIFNVMENASRHTFQILTKRPDRMRDYMKSRYSFPTVAPSIQPPKNVWLGVSVENQEAADERTRILLETPAAVRFVSAEPLLGTINFNCVGPGHSYRWDALRGIFESVDGISINPEAPAKTNRIDWVIVGGESGPRSRPMHPEWARSIRDQCQAAGVAFNFKQWGAWVENDIKNADPEKSLWVLKYPNQEYSLGDTPDSPGDDYALMSNVGKKAAGRLLDGRTWDEFPKNQGEQGVGRLNG